MNAQSQQFRTLKIETPPAFLPLINPARYKGAYGGRGSGKSHFFAESLIEQCLMAPTRAICIREVQDSLATSVKALIEDKIKVMEVPHYFRILQSHIGTPGGGVISFQGMNNHTAETIKSLEGYDIAWVEEAQTLSRRSLDLLRPTIRKENKGDKFRPESELWFSWNPTSAKDPVDELLRSDIKPPGAIVVEANYTDNPWFPEVLRKEMEYDKRRDPGRYAHVWLGKYQNRSETVVFSNWCVEDFETPADVGRFYFGADWGFSIDPTVLVRCYAVGRKLFVDYEAWQIGCEIDRTPALFDKVPGARKWPIVADSANPQSISYMKRNGFTHITPSIKGTGSVEEGVEFLKSFDIVVHSRCKHVIDELSTYCWKVDKKTEDILPKLADEKNHTIDSLRYATERLRRAGPIEVSDQVLAWAGQRG